MPGKTPKEAVERFAGFICETLSCITNDAPQAYQESDRLYKLLFKTPARVTAKNGDPFYISVTQTFTVIQNDDETFKVHTRQYSYVFSSFAAHEHKGILAYHWHPEDFSLRDPHLHITITPQTGYPEIERRIARAFPNIKSVPGGLRASAHQLLRYQASTRPGKVETDTPKEQIGIRAAGFMVREAKKKSKSN